MDKEIRVCFVSERTLNMTGSTQSLMNLTNVLSSNGVVPTIVSHKESEYTQYAKDHGIDTMIIPFIGGYFPNTRKGKLKGYIKSFIYKVFSPLVLQKIIHYLQKEKFDIIHLNSLQSCKEWAIAAKKLHIPYVWHIREYMDEDHNYKLVDEKKFLEIVRNADEVITISKDVQNYWSNRLNRKCRLIYNGFNIDTYYSDCHNKLSDETVKCVIVGRVSESKRQMDAILAIEKLINMGYKFHLDIVGFRDIEKYEKNCRNYIDSHNLSQNINLIPYTYDIRNAIKDSDIGLMCSTREAFGRVTIEYKLAGLLVVGSNTGGTPEIVEDGVTGLLYEMGNVEELAQKLIWVTKERSKAKSILEEGQKQAISDFCIENTANNVLDVYNTVLNDSMTKTL